MPIRECDDVAAAYDVVLDVEYEQEAFLAACADPVDGVVVQLRDASGGALWQATLTLSAPSTGGTTTPPGATISGPSAAATTGQAATFFVDLTGC